jgi:CelD/BcsL family acetyltransferase involved in cellulose biosynthesis
VIREEAEWDAIRPEWDRLYAASPYASTPLDFAWQRRWWRVYGPTYGLGGLRILTAWRGARLLAALPLYESRLGRRPFGVRVLRFLSTGEAEYEEVCPDYLNLLCLGGEEQACVDSLWPHLDGLAWDELELLDLPENSPLLSNRASPGLTETFARGACPFADLTGGFEAYLGALSSNSRQQARRLLREGERAGAALETVAVDQQAGAFDDLVRLHQARWTREARPGVFATARFTTFHREMIGDWLPAGRAVLARLAVDGEPLAVIYGFVTGSTFEFYQSGVRHDGPASLRSPGTLAHLLLMQALAARGILIYDFLRGASSHKKRLSTGERRLVGMRVWRPSLRSAAHQSLRLAAMVARRRLPSPFSRAGAR